METAAALIRDCDAILVAAGAGFSQDSGLPVYNDIAKVRAYQELQLEYQDICDPGWFKDDIEFAYGFWGDCYNMYQRTPSHAGYKVLQQLKAQKGDKKTPFKDHLQTLGIDSPFFIYTSNVDGHFHRHFQQNEIYEIHGNIQHWQCIKPCMPYNTWTLPDAYHFSIDLATRNAYHFESQRFLKCKTCNTFARPNILMFRDTTWLPNLPQQTIYNTWQCGIESSLKQYPNAKLVVLELGCGIRVPSVRQEVQNVVYDILPHNKNVHIIRINPSLDDIPPLYDIPNNHLLHLQLNASTALTRLMN